MADRVIIVEGVSALGNEVAPLLARSGFSVARVSDYPETLLASEVFRPDIVILDETLPNSTKVCRQIRRIIGTPVMLAGSDNSVEIRTKALLEAGADFYLRKPFSPAVLVARVRAILRRYGLSGARSGNEAGSRIEKG